MSKPELADYTKEISYIIGEFMQHPSSSKTLPNSGKPPESAMPDFTGALSIYPTLEMAKRENNLHFHFCNKWL